MELELEELFAKQPRAYTDDFMVASQEIPQFAPDKS